MPIYRIEDRGLTTHILFVSIPKSGGTAISTYFQSLGFVEHFGIENQAIRNLMICPPGHYEYRMLAQLFRLKALNYMFTVTVKPFRAWTDVEWSGGIA